GTLANSPTNLVGCHQELLGVDLVEVGNLIGVEELQQVAEDVWLDVQDHHPIVDVLPHLVVAEHGGEHLRRAREDELVGGKLGLTHHKDYVGKSALGEGGAKVSTQLVHRLRGRVARVGDR